MKMSGQLHAPAALPIGQEAGLGPITGLNAVVKKKSHTASDGTWTLVIQPVA